MMREVKCTDSCMFLGVKLSLSCIFLLLVYCCGMEVRELNSRVNSTTPAINWCRD
jgi:hypothetical protein